MTNKPLTVDEAARYLSVNSWQVREFVRQGLLPRRYKNIGNRPHLVFGKQTLIEFITQGKGARQLMDRPLTTKEAAEFLKVNRWQVYAYIHLKQLKAYKMGNGTNKKGSKRRWRIWEKDLRDFVNRSSNIKDNK